MKKLIIGFLSAITITTANAQFIDIQPEIGANFNSIRTDIGNNITQSDSKIGLRAGLNFKFDLLGGLYLKPGIFYSNKGSVYHISGPLTGNSYDQIKNLDYLEIPLNVGYKYQLLGGTGGYIFGEVGPYLGYALAGKDKRDVPVVGVTESKIEFGSDNSETNPLDYGFNFGLGYQTPFKVYIRGNYGLGLGNMSNLNNVTEQHRTWTLAVGITL